MASLRAVRRAVRHVASKVGLFPVVFAVYRWTVEWSPRKWLADHRVRQAANESGFPIPPARLLYSVATTPRATHFVESGRAAAESLRGVLDRAGRPFEDLRDVLDFGCGCGRVLRQWPKNGPTLYGCDYNPAGIGWLDVYMPWVDVCTNNPLPPLPYADGSFDFVYALSVFTHLPTGTQEKWMAELSRVLRPHGLLAMSTLGEAYIDRLTPSEHARFDQGQCVIRNAELAGSNLCAAYHPFPDVVDRLGRGYRLIEFAPSGATGNGRQDLYLLERLAT